PYISNFFERIELVEIIRILGLSIIFKAISLTEITKIRKKLQFKKLTIIQFTSSLVSIAIGYLMALYGWGYWSLVGQTVSIGIVNIILVFILNKWIPSFYFSIERYKTMRGFSNNLLL